MKKPEKADIKGNAKKNREYHELGKFKVNRQDQEKQNRIRTSELLKNFDKNGGDNDPDIDTDMQEAETRKEKAAPVHYEESEVERNRRKLKNRPAPVSFFSYMFYDYPRIRDFGRQTHIISTGIIPFRLKVNKEVERFFMEQLQKRYLATLISILNYVEKEGWQELSKKEYNLVLVLKRLCKALFSIDFNLLDYKDPDLIDKLHDLELNFFILYYRLDYIDLIIISIKKVIERVEKYRKHYNELPVMIKRIINKDITLPSLYNFLLGLNMLKYKRYLTLNHLINRKAGQLVSATEFECTDTVLKKIDNFVSEIETNMVPVINRYNEILKIKAFLPPADTGNKQFELLEYFYNDKQQDPPWLLSKDKSNIIHLTLNILKKFLDVFGPLLNGKVVISSAGLVEIFSSRFFALEMGRLQMADQKLEKLSYALSSMTLERFLELRISIKSGLSIEVEIVQSINEIVALFIDMGKKLTHVIMGRQKIKTQNQETNFRLEPEILTGRAFTLPYENKIVENDNILYGKTVIAALSFVCCLCMVCGLFYKNPMIHDLLYNEEKILKNIRSRTEIIQRIADTSRFREIKHKYKL